jgi:hypothetical protein
MGVDALPYQKLILARMLEYPNGATLVHGKIIFLFALLNQK